MPCCTQARLFSAFSQQEGDDRIGISQPDNDLEEENKAGLGMSLSFWEDCHAIIWGPTSAVLGFFSFLVIFGSSNSSISEVGILGLKDIGMEFLSDTRCEHLARLILLVHRW